MPTRFKITLVLYGVVLVANLALRHAVVSGVADPRGKLGLGLLLLLVALVWAVGLFVSLIIHRRRFSRGQFAVGWLLLAGAGVLFLVVAILWGSVGA